MGATVVLEMAAETPPAMKSLAKATGSARAGSMVPSLAAIVCVCGPAVERLRPAADQGPEQG